MSVSRQDGIPLGRLPLFRDIKEALVLEKQQQSKNGRPANEPRMIKKNRGNEEELRSGRQYIPPLSAYNAIEEVPYFPFGVDEHERRFDELTMRMDQTQRRLKSIRTLGWNSFRPIGVNETMQQLKEKSMKQEMKNERADDIPLPSTLQENGDESMGSFQEYDYPADPHNSTTNGLVEEADEAREDEDVSYDYDAEFARVEDEEEEEEEELRNATQSLGPCHAPPNRGAVRDLTIQQFVETSHVERQPYELEDEYETPQLDTDADQGDSRDFTEVPWVEISDTVHSGDSQRISSLNSLIDRVHIPTGRAHGTRRLSDNNSEVE